MKNIFSHHRLVVLLFSVLCSFSLSSCTFLFASRTSSSSDIKKDWESDVRDMILTYFDEVQGGRLLGAGYDPLLDLTTQHLQIAIENAAEELFQEGSINQQQQGDINNYFLDDYMSGILGVYAVYPPEENPKIG